MALVMINGRTVVLPDSLASLVPQDPPQPAPSAKPAPDPYPYDPAEDAFYNRSKSGGAPKWKPETGTWEGIPVKPAPKPRDDSARIGIQGFADGPEVAWDRAPEARSVTEGGIPTEQPRGTGQAPQMLPDYNAGTLDNRPETIKKSNAAYDKKQAALAKQQAAQAAYDASPEGRMAAADAAAMGAFQATDQANTEAAAVDSAAARERYEAMAGAQQESDRIEAERQRIAAEREKQRQQKAAQVESYVKDVDNFEIHDPGTMGNGSTANKIGRIIAMAMTGIGMALQGRGHESNPVIAMFDAQAQKDVQLQMDKRTQLQKRADRAEAGLDKFDRITDSTDARYHADMARAYERGIRMGDLAVAKYGDKKAEANWKQSRAELQQKQAEYMSKAAEGAFNRGLQREQMANQRQQTAISGGHLALAQKKQKRDELESDRNYELQKANLLLDAQKLEQQGNTVGAKMVLEQGVAAPPQAVTDANGNVTLNRNTGALKNADGNPWVIPTVDEAKDFRKKKAAAESIVKILDEMRGIREEVGGESEWGNSDAYQRLQVLKQNLVLLKKAGTQGMSSDADMARIEAALGADSPASFRSQAAKLDEGRQQVIGQLNIEASNLNYTGEPINYPDPVKLRAPLTAEQDAARNIQGFDITKADPADLSSQLNISEQAVNDPRQLRAALDAQGGILPRIKQNIDQFAAVLSSPTATPYAKQQAEQMLYNLGKESQDPRIRAYTSQKLNEYTFGTLNKTANPGAR